MTMITAAEPAGSGRANPALDAAGRIDWLDSARGAGIVLVVIGHALGGLIDSPLGAGLIGFRRAFFVIYTFHMPLFFVLSGLLVGKRIARGAGPFLKGLLPTVVWPYFLWSAVQFSVIYALGSLVNRPAGDYWETILALPWKTVSQFWFLHTLFWMHVIAVIVIPRIGRNWLVVIGIAAKLLLAYPPLAAMLVVPVKLIGNNLMWYAIGAALTPAGIGRLVIQRSLALRGAWLPLLAAALIGVTLLAVGHYGAELPLATAASPEIANLAWRLPALGAAVFGAAATIAIASLPVFGPGRAGRTGRRYREGSLAQLGRLTMPIFLLHVLFIAGTRIVLVRFAHIDNAGVLLVILVAVGLIGPLLVERVVRPTGLQRWLGF